jgi:ubiquinone/menaquinone biosynthesis C-methylase UbiE
MSKGDPFSANRAMWNETAAIHAEARLEALLQAVARDDFSTFDAVERRVFDQLDLRGKSVAQPCCNNARELVAVKKAGAGRCVGFDFSEAFLGQGEQIVKAAGVDIELVHVNVLQIPDAYSGLFDLAYVSVGALGWLPDVSEFFSVVARLLRPGGQLFLYDMHPALFLFDEERTSASDPQICRSYFQRDPLIFEHSRDYFDPTTVVESRSYWYQHTLGDVLSAVLAAGLWISSFEEYPHDVSQAYAAFEGQRYSIPMSYSLVARTGR